MDLLCKSSNGHLYTPTSKEVISASIFAMFCKFMTFCIAGHLKSYEGYFFLAVIAFLTTYSYDIKQNLPPLPLYNSYETILLEGFNNYHCYL